MPELPEVETIVRKIRPVLLGRSISAVELLWERTLDRPSPEMFRSALLGARVDAVGRRGKYIAITLGDVGQLLIHLRMSGKFVVHPPGEGPGDELHARVRLQLDDGTWLAYIDPRKFGRFYLVGDSTELLGHLGAEPLAPEFTAETLASVLQNRHAEIKRLLLDQTLLAGLGNIYANEALWRAGIHPQRTADSLDLGDVRRLHQAIVSVLGEAVAHGGTSLEDRQYVYPDGGLGGHQMHLSVYDRAGEMCPRCGYALERLVQGQRSTYFCPLCQRRPDRGGD